MFCVWKKKVERNNEGGKNSKKQCTLVGFFKLNEGAENPETSSGTSSGTPSLWC